MNNTTRGFRVFLGNLPKWVTDGDIAQWLAADGLVADSVRVDRDHGTQESKGRAFLEAPTEDEMRAIIRRFDRAPIEGRLLRCEVGHSEGLKCNGGFRWARR